ncbi:DUF257 family protein [Pyrococcus sp. ST04]|uniref:DUF257 family protein n=1 Tax=Pyrococcus sp. ST04 TaxID=1183377 RepID=UPI0002605FBB|nr:DUF257 family protein [Pyrococcus sp. ST04]AFK23347.1 hypothetical protein Py04_1779 [Pyrococcus sp. ST04]
MEIPDVIGKEKISVLVEHTSEDVLGPTVFTILNQIMDRYGKEALVIITDFLDTLPIYKYQAELLGIKTELIDRVPVIKVGGKINVGNVLHKIPISAYPVYKTLYEEALTRLLDSVRDHTGFFINLQVGIENIMNIFDRKELIEQVHDMGEYIVTKDRDIRDMVFVNTDSIKGISVEIVSMLKTIFPIVLKLTNDGKSFVISKSVFPNLKGNSGTIWEVRD